MDLGGRVQNRYRWMIYLALAIFLCCLAVNNFSEKDAFFRTDLKVFGWEVSRFSLVNMCFAIGMLLLCIANYLSTSSKGLKFFYLGLSLASLFLFWRSAQIG